MIFKIKAKEAQVKEQQEAKTRMKIETGERDEQWRVILDNGMLGGLITKVGDSYQVDMLMQIEAECSSEGEAMGFVQGVIAAYDIFFPAEPKGE